MSVVSKLKKLYIFSWVINIDCIFQMIFLPEECINLYALWKSSPFLLFSLYYFLLYFNTMVNKEMTAKYLDGKTVGLYYLHVILKIIIIIFTLAFVSYIRDTDNEILGIITQTIFFTLDFIIQILVVEKYKHIYNIPIEDRELHLIEYIPIKCTKNDMRLCNNIILLTLIKVFLFDVGCIMICFFRCWNVIYCILFLNIASNFSLNRMQNMEYSSDIQPKMREIKITLLYFFEGIYNIYSYFLIRELSVKFSINGNIQLIVGYVIYLLFIIFSVIIPLIKLNICMDKYLQDKNE